MRALQQARLCSPGFQSFVNNNLRSFLISLLCCIQQRVLRVRATLGPLHVFFQCLSESRHPQFCLISFTLHWANRLLTVTGGVVLNWLDQISQESVFFPLIDITDTSGAEGKLALAHICVPWSCSDKFQGLPERFNRSGLDLTSPWPNKVWAKSGQIKNEAIFNLPGIKSNKR